MLHVNIYCLFDFYIFKNKNFVLDDISSNMLYKANLTLYDFEACKTIYERNAQKRQLPNGLISGQLCAYDFETLSDSCQGDSGGPLQIVQNNSNIEVVGVVSIGISCGGDIPGVYTNIVEYLSWIEQEVWGFNFE